MIPTRPVVPLLSYLDPKTPKSAKEQRFVEIGDDRHQAVWGLYQYTDTAKVVNTIEARVLFGTWYNFCGGGRYFSPQVNHHSPSPQEWATSEACYCQPSGYGGKTFGGRVPDFSTGFKTAQRVIPSLNKILHVETLSQEDAEKIMWDSLANATLGYMSRTNKRFWVGADRVNGKLSYLTKIMQERASLPGYMSPIYVPHQPHTSGLTRAVFLSSASISRGLSVHENSVTKVDGINWNSSSACTMYTILLAAKGGTALRYLRTCDSDPHKYLARTGLDACCPKCKEDYTIEVTQEGKLRCYNCNHEIPVPVSKAGPQPDDDLTFYSETLEYVIQKVSSPTYLDHIPYGLWGN